MIAFHALQLMTAAKHSVEFIDEEGHRFVTFVGFDDGVHIGALNHDMTFGFEAGGDGFLWIAFQLDAESHDALLVTKQALGFFANERFQRWSQFEMNAGDDDFAMVLAVHVSAYGLG